MKYIKILSVLVLTTITMHLYGQNNTMYYMANIPQTYQLNPATQPKCNFFIGSPLITGQALMNTAISPSDFFWYDADMDSVVNPFTTNANLTEFIGKFDDTEQLTFNTDFNFLSFGFRANQMYFCFDATLKSSNRISFPKDMIDFMLQGPTDGRTYDFSDLTFETLNYLEFGVNISRDFGDLLTIGIRPKILYGLATITTQDKNVTLETSTEEWIIDSHSKTRMAITGVPFPYDEDGELDLSRVDDTIESLINDPPSFSDIFSSFNKNRGIGIDFGVHFRPIEILELSASLLDLGYIKWSDNPQSLILDGNYSFTGVDINIPDSLDRFQPIIDSLEENLSYSNQTESFRTSLNPKLILGGRIFLTPKIDVGLLSRTEFYPEKTNQDIVLLADFRPLRGFSFTTSYSMLGKGHSSIGLGWAVKIGPVSSYFMSEYNPFRYDKVTKSGEFRAIVPVDFYGFSFRMGANLTIGCNKAKKQRKDLPMFNSTEWNY